MEKQNLFPMEKLSSLNPGMVSCRVTNAPRQLVKTNPGLLLFKYVVYEIPKLKTKEEKKRNLPGRPDITNEKMIIFTRLLNKERISLGYSPFSVTTKEK